MFPSSLVEAGICCRERLRVGGDDAEVVPVAGDTPKVETMCREPVFLRKLEVGELQLLLCFAEGRTQGYFSGECVASGEALVSQSSSVWAGILSVHSVRFRLLVFPRGDPACASALTESGGVSSGLLEDWHVGAYIEILPDENWPDAWNVSMQVTFEVVTKSGEPFHCLTELYALTASGCQMPCVGYPRFLSPKQYPFPDDMFCAPGFVAIRARVTELRLSAPCPPRITGGDRDTIVCEMADYGQRKAPPFCSRTCLRRRVPLVLVPEIHPIQREKDVGKEVASEVDDGSTGGDECFFLAHMTTWRTSVTVQRTGLFNLERKVCVFLPVEYCGDIRSLDRRGDVVLFLKREDCEKYGIMFRWSENGCALTKDVIPSRFISYWSLGRGVEIEKVYFCSVSEFASVAEGNVREHERWGCKARWQEGATKRQRWKGHEKGDGYATTAYGKGIQHGWPQWRNRPY